MADAHKESELKGVSGFKSGPEGAGTSEEEQLVVTIKGPRGKVVRIEKIDKTGKRHELEHKEWAKLVGDDELDEIEEALEAGIAGIFGEEYEEDEAYEDDEEKALRRLLIGGLLRRRPIQRRILHRLLVSRLLRRQVTKRPA
jgi:hypothetical protein